MKRIKFLSILTLACVAMAFSQNKVDGIIGLKHFPKTRELKIYPIDSSNFLRGSLDTALLKKKFSIDDSKLAAMRRKKADRFDMPVVSPPDSDYRMIVVRPDSICHYHIRNLADPE